MTTRSVHLLTTASLTAENIVHAAPGTSASMISSGAVQVLYDDTYFRDKYQLTRALRHIINDIEAKPADSAFTGTI